MCCGCVTSSNQSADGSPLCWSPKARVIGWTYPTTRSTRDGSNGLWGLAGGRTRKVAWKRPRTFGRCARVVARPRLRGNWNRVRSAAVRLGGWRRCGWSPSKPDRRGPGPGARQGVGRRVGIAGPRAPAAGAVLAAARLSALSRRPAGRCVGRVLAGPTYSWTSSGSSRAPTCAACSCRCWNRTPRCGSGPHADAARRACSATRPVCRARLRVGDLRAAGSDERRGSSVAVVLRAAPGPRA